MSDDDKDDKDLEHPALKDFSEGVYTAKHVAGKTVKGGLIGGLVGGVGIPALAAIAGVAGVAASGPIGWLITAVGGGSAAAIIGGEAITSAVVHTAATAGLIGAGAGAAVGLATGVSGADEAVEKRKEEIVAQSERMEVRKERAEAVAVQKEQQKMAMDMQAQQMGLTPTQGLPQKPTDGLQLT